MRLLGEVENQDDGLLLGAYLLQNGIESRIEQERNGKCSVWVVDEDKMSLAGELIKKFSAQSDKSIYKEAVFHAKVIEDAKRIAQDKYEKRQIDPRARWGKQNGGKIVTSTLIGICVAIWVFEVLSPELIPYVQGIFMISNPYQPGMTLTDELMRGQVWRLFSPALLHAPLFGGGKFQLMGILHILFNMQWLNQLGGAIERRHGSRYMFVLFLVFSALPNLFQYTISGPAFLGMSGVNYALLSFLWIRGRFDPKYGMQLNPGLIWFMMIWFALGFMGNSTANWVHAGGIICGVAWGYISAKPWKNR